MRVKFQDTPHGGLRIFSGSANAFSIDSLGKVPKKFLRFLRKVRTCHPLRRLAKRRPSSSGTSKFADLRKRSAVVFPLFVAFIAWYVFIVTPRSGRVAKSIYDNINLGMVLGWRSSSPPA